MEEFDYVLTRWGVDRVPLQQVRRAVFILEQGVPEADEWDDADLTCAHVLALRNREPVGTGRLEPAGKIGRIAVLSEVRGRGIGGQILRLLLREARRRGLPEVHLHAQATAVSFYTSFGFVPEGELFDEAGILHRRMRLRLE